MYARNDIWEGIFFDEVLVTELLDFVGDLLENCCAVIFLCLLFTRTHP